MNNQLIFMLTFNKMDAAEPWILAGLPWIMSFFISPYSCNPLSSALRVRRKPVKVDITVFWEPIRTAEGYTRDHHDPSLNG